MLIGIRSERWEGPAEKLKIRKLYAVLPQKIKNMSDKIGNTKGQPIERLHRAGFCSTDRHHYRAENRYQ